MFILAKPTLLGKQLCSYYQKIGFVDQSYFIIYKKGFGVNPYVSITTGFGVWVNLFLIFKNRLRGKPVRPDHQQIQCVGNPVWFYFQRPGVGVTPAAFNNTNNLGLWVNLNFFTSKRWISK